jgi:hypothetical protein
MTYKKIFVQILSEVSGKSKKELNDTISSFHKFKPNNNLDKELSYEESQKLLNQLRKEGPGILAWLVEGAVKAASIKVNESN